MSSQKARLFQCTPWQALLALVPACTMLVALIILTVGFFRGYEGRNFLCCTVDSQGYVSVDYVWEKAKAAGLRVNDRIFWRSLDLETRLVFLGERWVFPGKPLVYPVRRGNEELRITRIADTFPPPSASDAFIWALQLFVACVVLGVGTLLVLLRPSKVTWAWFILSLWIASNILTLNDLGLIVAFSFLPAWLHLVIAELLSLLQPAAYFGLLVFALHFPDRQPQGLARRVDRLVPYAFAAVALLYFVDDLWSLSSLGSPFWLGRTLTWMDNIVPAVALTVATINYFHSRGVERQKIQWIAAAIALALVPYVGDYYEMIFVWERRASVQTGLNSTYAWDDIRQWLVLLYIAPSLALAYTILRHRVYDIRFVIRRAIVLTILTAVVVIVFALIDWLFVRRLEQTGLGVIVGILAVAFLGFTANAMHRRVDRFVDNALFKRRHLAKERLAQLARDLPSVRSLETLDAMLVKEPLRAFDLTSVALFRCDGGDTFLREDAIGWPEGALRGLKIAEEPLADLADLQDVARIRWRDPNNTEFPSPDAYPVLALPINVRGRLRAMALYGPHEDGLDFDPDEIRAISGLMVPAAAAYDHLEAEEVRRENERMRLEIEALRDQSQQPDTVKSTADVATDSPEKTKDSRSTN